MTTVYRFRFYSPDLEPHINEAGISLLGEIRDRWGIGYELVPLRLVPSMLSAGILVPDQEHVKGRYLHDFLPHWRRLNERTGTKLSKVLRSRSGGYFLAGTLALVSDTGVEWYST